MELQTTALATVRAVHCQSHPQQLAFHRPADLCLQPDVTPIMDVRWRQGEALTPPKALASHRWPPSCALPRAPRFTSCCSLIDEEQRVTQNRHALLGVAVDTEAAPSTPDRKRAHKHNRLSPLSDYTAGRHPRQALRWVTWSVTLLCAAEAPRSTSMYLT